MRHKIISDLIPTLNTYSQFYIIGTSTDVGKTYVGCKLLDSLLPLNAAWHVFKPVETGLEGNAVGSDTQHYLNVFQSHSVPKRASDLNLFSLDVPCSPHLAEQLEKKHFPLEKIIPFCKQKHAFIELAGGLMVPLNENETQLDLIKARPYPIVLVAHAGLGTLNHVMLTLDVLKTHVRKLPIHIILNFYEQDNLIHKTNYDYLSARYDCFISPTEN